MHILSRKALGGYTLLGVLLLLAVLTSSVIMLTQQKTVIVGKTAQYLITQDQKMEIEKEIIKGYALKAFFLGIENFTSQPFKDKVYYPIAWSEKRDLQEIINSKYEEEAVMNDLPLINIKINGNKLIINGGISQYTETDISEPKQLLIASFPTRKEEIENRFEKKSVEVNNVENKYARYKSLIEIESARQGVDPAIVTAMLFTESRFDPNARSQTNACGIAQFVDSTWRDYCAKARREGLNIDCKLNSCREGDSRLNPSNSIAMEALFIRDIDNAIDKRFKDCINPTARAVLTKFAYHFGIGALKEIKCSDIENGEMFRKMYNYVYRKYHCSNDWNKKLNHCRDLVLGLVDFLVAYQHYGGIISYTSPGSVNYIVNEEITLPFNADEIINLNGKKEELNDEEANFSIMTAELYYFFNNSENCSIDLKKYIKQPLTLKWNESFVEIMIDKYDLRKDLINKTGYKANSINGINTMIIDLEEETYPILSEMISSKEFSIELNRREYRYNNCKLAKYSGVMGFICNDTTYKTNLRIPELKAEEIYKEDCQIPSIGAKKIEIDKYIPLYKKDGNFERWNEKIEIIFNYVKD